MHATLVRSTMRSSPKNSCAAIRATAPSLKSRCSRRRGAPGIASGRGRPASGVWRFLCRPELTAIQAPALWLTSTSPLTVRFAAVPSHCAGLTARQLLARADVIEDRVAGGLRYLALRAADTNHRLVLPKADKGSALASVIAPDRGARLRIAAVARLLDDLGIAASVTRHTALNPTRFQQHRFTLLLAILDRLDRAVPARTTLRDVAGLVYRDLDIASAAAWKASSQRRHTQRLIAEAQRLVDEGYRALLWGNILKR